MTELTQGVPNGVVDESGHPRFGAYRGAFDAVRWEGLAAPWKVGVLARMARAKKWQYASIANDRVLVACCIVRLGYASNAFVYVFDRRERRFGADLAWTGVAGAAKVSDRPRGGATFRTRKVEVDLGPDAVGEGWRVKVRAAGVAIDAHLEGSGAPAGLCAVTDLGAGRVNATHKSVGLVAVGEARVDGRRWDLAGSAALDHTSGLLHRETRWKWASATGPGFGLNIVSGFNGPVENIAWIGERMWSLGPISVDYDGGDPMRTWHFRSASGAAVEVDLRFEPEGARRANTNLLVAKSIYVQPIGAFYGVIRTPEGVHTVDGVPGVTEDHVALW
jgi:hypothetical protein